VIFIRENIKFLFVFILPAYFYIVQNSIQNKHSHFTSNGIVVTHSHPFDAENDNPFESHQHTKTEICFFSQLNFDYYNFSPDLQVLSVEPPECILPFLKKEVYYNSVSLFQPDPRGPPHLKFQPILRAV
jgi:hypothetical protein